MDICGWAFFSALVILGESIGNALFDRLLFLCFEVAGDLVLVVGVVGDEIVFDWFLHIAFAD